MSPSERKVPVAEDLAPRKVPGNPGQGSGRLVPSMLPWNPQPTKEHDSTEPLTEAKTCPKHETQTTTQHHIEFRTQDLSNRCLRSKPDSTIKQETHTGPKILPKPEISINTQSSVLRFKSHQISSASQSNPGLTSTVKPNTRPENSRSRPVPKSAQQKLANKGSVPAQSSQRLVGNRILLSGLQFSPRPNKCEATGASQLEPQLRLTAKSQDTINQPTGKQNKIRVPELKLNPRPIQDDASLGSKESPKLQQASAAQGIPASQITRGVCRPPGGNRILPATLKFKPRPNKSQNGNLEMKAGWDDSEGEWAEGTILAASPTVPGSTSGKVAPILSVNGNPFSFPPALTSTLQGIAFVPATTSSDDGNPILLSPTPSVDIDPSSTATSCFADHPSSSGSTKTNEMVPSKTVSSAIKANLTDGTPVKATSSAVCSFILGTCKPAAAVKGPSMEVSSASTGSSMSVCPNLSLRAAPGGSDQSVAAVVITPALTLIAKPQPGTDMKVHLLLAEFGYQQADSIASDLMTILQQIENRHGAKIEVDSVNNRLILHVQSKQQFLETKQALQKAMWLESDTTKTWRPSIFLAPTKIRKSDFKAVLDIDEHPAGIRPRLAPGNGQALLPHEYNALQAKWQNAFRNKVFEAAKAMSVRPLQMCMRIHLGKIRLQGRQKNKTVYTYDELDRWLNRYCMRDITFNFDPLLGDNGFGFRILEKIYHSPDLFEPLDTRFKYVQDVIPKHTLMLQTVNLMIETDVISVQETDASQKVLRLGPARGYRREQRNEVMEIATALPESIYDWDLSVKNRVPVGALPFTHEDISKNSTLTARGDPEEFPVFIIRPDFTEFYKLEGMKGKTSWVFKLKGSSYVIEVSLYCLLAANTSKTVPNGCGFDIFRAAWDEELGVHNLADGPRKWAEHNFEELFPIDATYKSGKDGISTLLNRVSDIHSLISRMAVEDSPGNPRTQPPVLEEEDLLQFEDRPVQSPSIGNEDLLMFEETLTKKELKKQEASSSNTRSSDVAMKQEAQEELLIAFD